VRFCFFVVLVASVALAQVSTPLTGPELDMLIRDWPEVIAWADQKDDQLGSLAESPSLLAAYVAGTDLYGLIQSKGWAQPERFFIVAAQASAALVRIEIEDEMPAAIAEINETKKAIQADPNLTAQQKNEIMANMDVALQAMTGAADTVPVTDGEVQLVRARRAEVAALFE
jgi:hypothetical protein